MNIHHRPELLQRVFVILALVTKLPTYLLRKQGQKSKVLFKKLLNTTRTLGSYIEYLSITALTLTLALLTLILT